MPNPPAIPLPPLPPGPRVILPSGHPCNPQDIGNGVKKIKVDDNGVFDRDAMPRPAISDPNHPGCYKLAQNAGRRKYRSKTKKHTRRRRHTRRK